MVGSLAASSFLLYKREISHSVAPLSTKVAQGRGFLMGCINKCDDFVLLKV